MKYDKTNYLAEVQMEVEGKHI